MSNNAPICVWFEEAVDCPDMSKNSEVHTVVVSDIHLADTEPPHPKNPLWKKFKNPEYLVDAEFKKFLEEIQRQIAATGSSQQKIELILNGDIFDFDSVMAFPQTPLFKVSRLEKLRGLGAEEEKSRFKLKTILDHHPVWLESLRDFLKNGHRIVFVIGNHDIEFHWPSVQQDFIDRLGGPVSFSDWFYVSNQDTLIEHGNQYDMYCLCTNPINPLIRKHHKTYVRLPFGNLASRYMLNGMGLMNPHSEASFIRSSLSEYLVFYYKYVVRTQPLLLWTWFWGALVTLGVTLSEGFRPANKDPLTVASRIDQIAERSNSTAGTMWALRALHAHPVCFKPLRLMQELWLDRAALFLFVLWVSFQFYTFVHLIFPVSILWLIIPMILLMPAFIFYARSVHSEVEQSHRSALKAAPLSAQIAKVQRVVHGHTHLAMHAMVEGIEYLNTGTWSPAFRDVECMQPYGKKCFAWIRPKQSNRTEREALLFEWGDRGAILIENAG